MIPSIQVLYAELPKKAEVLEDHLRIDKDLSTEEIASFTRTFLEAIGSRAMMKMIAEGGDKFWVQIDRSWQDHGRYKQNNCTVYITPMENVTFVKNDLPYEK